MKRQDFSLTTSSGIKPSTPGYRTFSTFPRSQNFEPSNTFNHNLQQSFEEGNIELIRSIVQAEMTGTLRVIKVEIQGKMKEIDVEIRSLRQQLFKLKQSTDQQALIARVAQLEKSNESLIASVSAQAASRAFSSTETRNNEILTRHRSERSTSRDRKPIFSKPDGSFNLSNILFPEEDSRGNMKNSIEDKKQDIDLFLRPSYLLEKANQARIELIDEDEALQIHEPEDNLKDTLLIELNRNKTQFLRNKGKAVPAQPPHVVELNINTVAGGLRANQTILEEEQEESFLSSGNKKKR